LPADYPAPTAERECQAYCSLRLHWGKPQIRRFTETYGTEEIVYPGILDTPECRLSLTDFQEHVGVLAIGEHARTLPRTDMLARLAGKDAARGAQTVDAASKGGEARARDQRENNSARDRDMADEFTRRLAKGGGQSPTALKAQISKKKGLRRSASIAAINSELNKRK
jgi:hypothetical protein